MLADAQGDLAKALGLEMVGGALGPIRCKRFSMVVDNGKITHLNIEPEGGGLTCSLSNVLLASL